MRFMAKGAAAQQQPRKAEVQPPSGAWASSDVNPGLLAGKKRLFRAVVDRDTFREDAGTILNQSGVTGVVGRMSFARFNVGMERRASAAMSASTTTSPDVCDTLNHSVVDGDAVVDTSDGNGEQASAVNCRESERAPRPSTVRVGQLRPSRGGGSGYHRSGSHKGGSVNTKKGTS